MTATAHACMHADKTQLWLVAAVLWLSGMVCGLLLPHLLQLAALWLPLDEQLSRQQQLHASDGDSSVGSLQLLSRPLNDVPAELEELVETPRISAARPPSLRLQQLLLAPAGSGALVTPHWQVTAHDLLRFTTVVDPVEGRLLTGDLGSGWSHIMTKETPGLVKYASYMRPTAQGKSDYLSITVVHGATAQEMQEFNMDDAARAQWDPMLRQTWLLASGRGVQDSCEQLVVWLRSFPMGFVSDRLYSGIARREFADPAKPDCLWGVTKGVHTPATLAWAAEKYPGVMLNDSFFSAWLCRTIRSPWSEPGGGAEPLPACAIILLHHDDLKVPEYLARTSIRLGMWPFVQGMVKYAGTWLQERRARVDPFAPDPHAACRQPAPGSPAEAAPAAPTAGASTSSSSSSPASGAKSSQLRGTAGQLHKQQADSPHTQQGVCRLLHPVPTAPGELHLLAAGDGGADSSLIAAAGSGSRAAFSNGSFPGTPHGRSYSTLHKRAHSLEWELEPGRDDAAGSATAAPPAGGRSTTSVQASGAAGGVAAGPRAAPFNLLEGSWNAVRGVLTQQLPGALSAVPAAAGRLLMAPVHGAAAAWGRLQQGKLPWGRAPHAGGGEQLHAASSSNGEGQLPDASLQRLQQRLPRVKVGQPVVLAPAGPDDSAASDAGGSQQRPARWTAAAAGTSPFGSSGAGAGASGSSWRRCAGLALAAAAAVAGVLAARRSRRPRAGGRE